MGIVHTVGLAVLVQKEIKGQNQPPPQIRHCHSHSCRNVGDKYGLKAPTTQCSPTDYHI